MTTTPRQLTPSLLTIAGFDPTSGAGITQDIMAFKAYGYHALAVPAVVVAEDSVQATAVFQTSPEALDKMLALLSNDFQIAGVKVGLLSSNPTAIRAIGKFLREVCRVRQIPVVFDPVLTTSRGDHLAKSELLPLLKEEILPNVDLITPNLHEFAAWIGAEPHAERDLVWAMQYGEAFIEQYSTPLLLTGLDDSGQVIDLLFEAADCQIYASSRVDADPHGTGCLHSSLLLMALVRGKSLQDAAAWAKSEMHRHLNSLQYPARSHRPFLPVGLV